MDQPMKARILKFQRSEITEYHVYRRLADSLPESHNRSVLIRISEDEKRHYGIWKRHTGRDTSPDRLKIWRYYLISKIFGLTFGVKLMERGEENAQDHYRSIVSEVPEAEQVAADEDAHEADLLRMIDEERLKYVGSIVLGLNDALVELTGALSGLTLALQNTRLVASAGLITGIAAALSMAASEYISTKSEDGEKDPVKAAVYTGIAYLLTVLFLIVPYLLFDHLFVCLGLTLLHAVIVIFIFTFYVSVAQEIPFKRRFIEMAGLSLGVAFFSFFLGFAVRKFMNIEI